MNDDSKDDSKDVSFFKYLFKTEKIYHYETKNEKNSPSFILNFHQQSYYLDEPRDIENNDEEEETNKKNLKSTTSFSVLSYLSSKQFLLSDENIRYILISLIPIGLVIFLLILVSNCFKRPRKRRRRYRRLSY